MVVVSLQGNIVFTCKLEYRIRRTISRLRPVDPIGTDLHSIRHTRRPKQGTLHSSSNLIAGFNDFEIMDALLVKSSRGNYTCHTTSEYKYLCMVFTGPIDRKRYLETYGKRRKSEPEEWKKAHEIRRKQGSAVKGD